MKKALCLLVSLLITLSLFSSCKPSEKTSKSAESSASKETVESSFTKETTEFVDDTPLSIPSNEQQKYIDANNRSGETVLLTAGEYLYYAKDDGYYVSDMKGFNKKVFDFILSDCVEKDGWIYGIKREEGIYRFSLNGEKKEKISSLKPSCLLYSEKYIFSIEYISGSNNALEKVIVYRTDYSGNNIKKIFERKGDVDCWSASEDSIYFVDQQILFQDARMFKFDFNGDNFKQVTSITTNYKEFQEGAGISKTFIHNGNVYFTLELVGTKRVSRLYMVSKNGTQNQMLLEKKNFWKYYFTKEKILSQTDDYNLYSYDYNIKNKQLICKNTGFSIYYSNQALYYYNLPDSKYDAKDSIPEGVFDISIDKFDIQKKKYEKIVEKIHSTRKPDSLLDYI